MFLFHAQELVIPSLGLDITTAKLKRSDIKEDQTVYVIRDKSQQGRQDDLFGPFYAPLNFLLYPLSVDSFRPATVNTNKDEEAEKGDPSASAPATPAGPAPTALELLQQLTGLQIPTLSSLIGTPAAAASTAGAAGGEKAPEPDKESTKPKPVVADVQEKPEAELDQESSPEAPDATPPVAKRPDRKSVV